MHESSWKQSMGFVFCEMGFSNHHHCVGVLIPETSGRTGTANLRGQQALDL